MNNLVQPILKPIPNRDMYMLYSDYSINVDGHSILVPQYFEFDGASIPRIGWQITYTPFDPDVMMPALIHDWLYYNHQVGRKEADEIFYKLLIKNGASNSKSNIMYQAVRIGGSFAWDNDAEDDKAMAQLYLKVANHEQLPRYKFPLKVQTLASKLTDQLNYV